MMTADDDRQRPSQPTFVLLHGAGSDSWYWHLVAPHLQDAGYQVIAVDLPVDDDSCGLADYTAAALKAIGSRTGLIVVAQSMAAYTAPMIAAAVPVEQVVLVAPMVPAPGETPGEWWANTGQPEAARRYAIQQGRDPDQAFDPVEVFLHDVDPAVIAESATHVRPQSARPFDDPWPPRQWPDVATRCVIARYDRFFPLDFQRRVVDERLGIPTDTIDSGHLPALSRPGELTQLLLQYGSGRPTSARGRLDGIGTRSDDAAGSRGSGAL
jgi:pimeloyl-ACP methyl ester carboxylesterase